MAFNPFVSFQKNQKFWMATILFLCMTTFVFCSGTGGDFGDKISKWLRPRGSAVAYLDGKLYRNDLYELRTDRNLANEMMRKCADLALKNVSKHYADEAAKPVNNNKSEMESRNANLVRWKQIQDTLLDRVRRPRYFDLGVKYDDLIEFKLWQSQAARLGVNLTTENINSLFLMEFMGTIGTDDIRNVEYEVTRQGGSQVNSARVLRVVGEEFRVRIAELACLKAQPLAFYTRKDSFNEPKLSDPTFPDQIRAPLSLAQLFDFYKLKRSEYDVTLIPVHVQDFVAKVPAAAESDLTKYFDAHKKQKYDPASPELVRGLELPHHIKVEMLMADPTSPAYQAGVKSKRWLEGISSWAFTPMQSPLIAAARAGAFAAAEKHMLQRQYESVSRVKYRLGTLVGPEFMSPMAAWFSHKHPEAAASALAGAGLLDSFNPYSALSGYLAWGAVKHAAAIEAGMAEESNRRAPLYASALAASLAGTPTGLPAAYQAAGGLFTLSPDLDMEVSSLHRMPILQSVYLPLSVVESDIQDMIARRTAEVWAINNMRTIRKEFEKSTSGTAAGVAARIRQIVDRFVGPLKLTHVVTSKYYNRFTIADAKELAPLKESFEKYAHQVNWLEGREVTPEKMLREGDFYKLFFDNERFAAGAQFKLAAWPPMIAPNGVQMRQRERVQKNPFSKDPEFSQTVVKDMVNLVDQQMKDPGKQIGEYDLFNVAEKPILFWKSVDKSSDFPDKLEQVRDRVVDGVKLEQARDKEALPLVKEIAEKLQSSGGAFGGLGGDTLLRGLAAKASRELIVLEKLAPLHLERVGFKREYGAYPLPKDKLAYPTDDLLANLLALYEPAKAIETGMKEVDDLNKTLFNLAKKENQPAGKHVQVLVNKPRSVFYIAVVSRPPQVSREEFAGAVFNAALTKFQFQDALLPRAQEEHGRAFRAQLVEQFREAAGYVLYDEKARADFENDSGN